MSDPISALKGAKSTGGYATITEMGAIGMITLRGDLSDKTLTKAAVAASGVTLPAKGTCNTEGESGMAWMSPDELLILCPHAQVRDRLADLQSKLSGQHALAVNVSDARAMFRIRSPRVREVMAKLAPVDMHPDHFPVGSFRRTRLAQVPAAFWLAEPDAVQLICFRSVAGYVFEILKRASEKGFEVDHFAVNDA